MTKNTAKKMIDNDQVNQVRLLLLIKQTHYTGILSVVFAAILSWMMSGYGQLNDMLIWVFCLAVNFLIRHLFFYRKIKTNPDLGKHDFVYQHRIIIFFLGISGVLWGLGIYFFLPSTDIDLEMTITFFIIIIGITAGNIPSFAPSFPGYLCFMVPTLIGVQIKTLQMDYFAMFIVAFLYMIYMAGLAIRISNVVINSISTDVKNERLLQEVSIEKDRAQDANQEISLLLNKKNDLIANISHEFRTPLTLIMGPIEKWIKKTSDQTLKKELLSVNQNAKRLLNMVDELLELSHIEHQKSNDRNNPLINFSYTVQQCIDSMHSLFIDHQLIVRCDILPDVNCHMDHRAAEKVLINLLSNAVKYSDPGDTVSITLNVDNQRLMLEVSDQGEGISPHDLPSIFDRFTRLDSDKTRNVTGSGLGLALCKEIVEHHHGKISVISQPQKGSTFTVELPVALNKTSNDTKNNTGLDDYTQREIALITDESCEKNTHQNANNADNDHTNYQVLIVDDNKNMRDYIASCLDQRFDCIFAHDGDQGINIAIEYIPDIIITDLMMPNKNGYELAKSVRNNHRTCHIPLIMLTAKADNTSRIEAWKSDIDEFLDKPFSAEELNLRTINLLNIRHIIGQRLNSSINQQDLHKQYSYNVLNKKDQQFIENIEHILNQQYANIHLNAKNLAEKMAMSERQLSRKFKALLSQSISEYVRTFRLNKAADLLKKGEQITEISFAVGFNSANYFSKCFKAQFGCSPRQYQNQLTKTTQ